MKVLHLVSAPTMTGPADPALGLARGQRDLGVDAWLAFDTQRTGNMHQKVREAEIPSPPGLVLGTKAGVFAALRDRGTLRRLARDFDIIHAHSSHDHALALGASTHAPIVRSIHHPRGCRRRGLQGFAYRRTAGFVLVADQHRELLLESYPDVEQDRARVVPGAVDIRRFDPAKDGSVVRGETGFGPERLLLGMVARIKPGRGHGLALEALVEARKARPELALALIGKGEGVPETEARIDALDLRSHVAMLGFRDEDLAETIRACDFTVLLEEGNDASCRAVLESMACGVPVLGADLPAIRDALQGASGGRIFTHRSREDLTAAFVEAADCGSAARRARGEQARARILARHTDEARARAVLDAYSDWGIGA